jgi:hypothetical protein
MVKSPILPILPYNLLKLFHKQGFAVFFQEKGKIRIKGEKEKWVEIF